MYDFEFITLFIILFIFLILLFIFYYNFIYKCFEKFEINSTEPPKYNPLDLNNYSTRPPIPEPEAIYMDYILANTHSLIPSTNEFNNNNDFNYYSNSNNSNYYNPLSINPQLGIASQLSLMSNLKKENDIIRKNTKNNQDILQSLQTQLFNINSELENKKKEKIKLVSDINNMNISRYTNNANITMILKVMENNIIIADKLKKYEEQLIKKKKEIEKLLLLPKPTIPPVTIKDEQIKPIKEKLDFLEQKITEINNKTPNNICTSHSSMPHPQKDAFLYDYEKVNNPSYAWCVCNDKNKHSDECILYMDCNKNYLNNKDKEGLVGDDLNLYMKCLSRYPNFPKYLSQK